MAENNDIQKENDEVMSSAKQDKSSAHLGNKQRKDKKQAHIPNTEGKPAPSSSTTNTQAKDNQAPSSSTETKLDSQNTVKETVVIKKRGGALSVLAILIALGVGGVTYFHGHVKMRELQQRVALLEQAPMAVENTSQPIEANNSEQQKALLQLAQLEQQSKLTEDEVKQLESIISEKTQQITSLQTQVEQLASQKTSLQPREWLLSETDFLLNSALQKLILDDDIDTAITLLKLADKTLQKINDPQLAKVKTALNRDLSQLLALDSVDQDMIMQRLSQLANQLDELTVLNVNLADGDGNDTDVTNSVEDWKTNVSKSATSFLNHFIRITPRQTNDRVLLAPNQDIYLRENIRLRLQLAMLAVPRQQNELYQQSLETVASWIRSYFDTHTESAENFLKNIDELAETSIYIDVPTQLSSLNLLNQLLNKAPKEVNKVSIAVDKSIASMPSSNADLEENNPKPETNNAPQEMQSTEQQPASTTEQEGK